MTRIETRMAKASRDRVALRDRDKNYNKMTVAQVAADFLASNDPRRERCWIAERDGKFLGFVLLVRDPERPGTASVGKDGKAVMTGGGAKLRNFLVEPEARGLGLGWMLIQKLVAFARDEAGYERVRLMTNGRLASARHLYRKAGFEIVETVGKSPFDREVDEEIWELRFGKE